MRDKIRSYILRKAKMYNYDFRSDVLLDELVNDTEEYYDSLVNAGFSKEHAMEATIDRIGNIEEYFGSKIDYGQHINKFFSALNSSIKYIVVALALILVGIYFLTLYSMLVFWLIDIAVIGLLFRAMYKINVRQFLFRQKREKVNKEFMFYILLNIYFMLPACLNLSFTLYVKTLGMVLLLGNISYSLLISKRLSRIFWVTVMAGCYSVYSFVYRLPSFLVIISIGLLLLSYTVYVMSKINVDNSGSKITYIGVLVTFAIIYALKIPTQYFDLLFFGYCIILMGIIYYRQFKKIPFKVFSNISLYFTLISFLYLIWDILIFLIIYSSEFRFFSIVDFPIIHLFSTVIVNVFVIEFLNYFIFNIIKKVKIKQVTGELKYEENLISTFNNTCIDN